MAHLALQELESSPSLKWGDFLGMCLLRSRRAWILSCGVSLALSLEVEVGLVRFFSFRRYLAYLF